MEEVEKKAEGIKKQEFSKQRKLNDSNSKNYNRNIGNLTFTAPIIDKLVNDIKDSIHQSN